MLVCHPSGPIGVLDPQCWRLGGTCCGAGRLDDQGLAAIAVRARSVETEAEQTTPLRWGPESNPDPATWRTELNRPLTG